MKDNFIMMQKRLDPMNGLREEAPINENEYTSFEMMQKRLKTQGGIHQEDRMIKGKWQTLQRALKYSYQACTVSLVQPRDKVLSIDPYEIDLQMGVYPNARALINPNKVKQDYDDKILSIDYCHNFGPGDVFQWVGTDTYWLIYLEEITEDAYFRGDIRRCKYKIKFKDKEGNPWETWAAVRGPVETQINFIQKNQISVDLPNLGLNILMPKNEYTIEAFNRYKEFILDGKCWRVEAIDPISMKNILEVNAEEYYIDRDKDDMPNELKDGLVIEPVDSTPDSAIVGEAFIRPKIAEEYIAPEANGIWSIVEKNCPVEIQKINDKTATIVWTKSTSGQFTLQWSKDSIIDTKVIVVESLF